MHRHRWTNDELTLALAFSGEHIEPLGAVLESPDPERLLSACRRQLIAELRTAMRERGGFETRVEEILVTEWECPDSDSYHLQAKWNPQSRQAELLGGPLDGLEVEVGRVGEPLYWSEGALVTAGTPGGQARDGLSYRLAGWCERTARWLYALPID